METLGLTCYRIYTEDIVHRHELNDLIRRYFADFTLLRGTGYFTQVEEPCVIIEILLADSELQRVIHLAGDIRHVFHQQQVLVTEHPVKGHIIVGQTA